MASRRRSMSSGVSESRCWLAWSTTSVIASLISTVGSSSTTRGRLVARNSSSEPASETRLNLLIRETSRVVAVQHCLCKLSVGVGAFGGAGVLQDRGGRQRRLRETDRVLDGEVVDEVAEML